MIAPVGRLITRSDGPKGYDDRESNLSAKCATCHFRKTKREMLDLEDESEDE